MIIMFWMIIIVSLLFSYAECQSTTCEDGEQLGDQCWNDPYAKCKSGLINPTCQCENGYVTDFVNKKCVCPDFMIENNGTCVCPKRNKYLWYDENCTQAGCLGKCVTAKPRCGKYEVLTCAFGTGDQCAPSRCDPCVKICTCKDGYQKDSNGNCTPKTCTDGSKNGDNCWNDPNARCVEGVGTFFGMHCVCENGFVSYNNSCECPAYKVINSNGTCVCPIGTEWVRYENQCVQPRSSCDPNQVLECAAGTSPDTESRNCYTDIQGICDSCVKVCNCDARLGYLKDPQTEICYKQFDQLIL